MKNAKLFILGAAACCLSMISNAQISYGPVLGLNMASNVGSNTDDLKMKAGFHLGIVVDWHVSDKLAFETGATYSQKGTKFDDADAPKLEINYLEIPFMPKYTANSGFNFYMGPYLGILMSSKLTDGSDEIDLKEFTNSIEAGMKFGLGYQLASGLAFSTHYGIGCTSIDKEDEGGKVYNSVFGISLAYMLGGKK